MFGFFRDWHAKRELKRLSRDVIGVNGAYAFLDEPMQMDVRTIATIQAVLGMGEWYLPWYKPDVNGHSGYHFEGSANWKLSDYAQALISGEVTETCELSYLHESLGQGAARDIQIVAARDTRLNKTVIVDGVKRAITLQIFALKKAEALVNLLGDGKAGSAKIKVVEFSSAYMRQFFPSDFLRLRFPPPSPENSA